MRFLKWLKEDYWRLFYLLVVSSFLAFAVYHVVYFCILIWNFATEGHKT